MTSIKATKSQYIGKRFSEADPFSIITKCEAIKGTSMVVLLSGKTGEYDIEAIIDRASGKNLIPNRSRTADSISDAVDVAMEMLESH